MIEMNDDGWELFVPVKGEKYPDACQYRYRRIDHEWSEWSRGPIGVADYPRNDVYQYRKPKQKENKMPDRTPQQALKDAIESGAVGAWINGEQTEIAADPHEPQSWISFTGPESFLSPLLFHRVRSPEPTRINWRPVVTGKEPEGEVLCLWHGNHPAVRNAWYNGSTWVNDEDSFSHPTHWAPMCNLPEGDK